MANPLFRRQVEELFQKLSWPFDPAHVESDLRAQGNSHVADAVQRGQGIVDVAKGVGRAGLRAGEAVAHGVGRVMAPAHVEGKALMGELGEVGRGIAARPGLMRAGIGALALAPILGGAFHASQQQHEGDLMNLQMNPVQKQSSLDSFLEKKATASYQMHHGPIPGATPSVDELVRDMRTKLDAGLHPSLIKPTLATRALSSMIDGLGAGIGQGLVSHLFSGLSGGIDMLKNSLIVDPQRKRLFESVCRTDPVIHDALTRTPRAAQTLAEAYQTMTRFAPSLSMDVNAVRSFLREAVVGGSAGVNYATIKTLIETERGLSSGDRR